jgi:cytoskeleton protein RodZ
MAATVMASVGAFLRGLRTRRGVSLEEIARKTRVAQRYLEALEGDAYDDLPAPVFIRGFIRAYCQALGESPEEALAIYDRRDGRIPPPVPRPAPIPPAGSTDPRSRGTIVVSFVLLVVLGMALFTVALVIQPRDRASTADTPAAPETTTTSSRPARSAPPVAAPPVAPPATAPRAPSAPTRPPAPLTPPPTATPPAPAVAARPAAPPAASAAVPGTPAPAPSADASVPSGARPPATLPGLEGLAGSVSSPYRLVARITDTSWIRVRTEDGRTSEETLLAGEIREWVSDRPFVVTIGNAGGVALELNGHALPPLGAKGAVIQRLALPPAPR